ncbi:hypothetical protein ZWY2020_016971 [Hordeum vulgare]|nr:hypothetical protein ZWY2020_016971 [Hordeum vulgare]
MAYSASGSISGAGGAPESNWPLSLDSRATEELHRYKLLVPPGCRLAKPWKVSKDGYATLGPTATADEVRNHCGGRHNIRGWHVVWDVKSFNAVIGQHRLVVAAAGTQRHRLRWRRRQPQHRPASS